MFLSNINETILTMIITKISGKKSLNSAVDIVALKAEITNAGTKRITANRK